MAKPTSQFYALNSRQIEVILHELEVIDFGPQKNQFWDEMWKLIGSCEHRLDFTMDNVDASFDISIDKFITIRVIPSKHGLQRYMWSKDCIYTKSPYPDQAAATRIYDKVLEAVLAIAV